MANPCSDIEAFISALEKRRDQLIDILTKRQNEGGRTDAIRRQIKELQSQILQEMILLKKLKKKIPDAGITGQHFVFIEKTQSIQYFDTAEYILPGTTGIHPNNSIPLICNRVTFLRVYINGSFDKPGFVLPAEVTGKLLLKTKAGPVTLSPVNRSLGIRPLDQINRIDGEHTLNFLLPKEYCSGQLVYTLQLTNKDGGDSFFSDTQTIDFIELPSLKIHLINVHYTGYEYNDKPINKTADLITVFNNLDEILQVYPINHISIEGIETIEWNRQLTFDENREALLEMIDMLRNISGSNALFIGVVPEEAGYSSFRGKDLTGDGICIINANATARNIAHEIGHSLGRLHAPACLPANERGDINYPQYNGFLKGSIGEVGIDLRSFEYKDPALLTDYMSSCPDASWTSPHGYLQLLKIIQNGVFSDLLPGKLIEEEKRVEYYHVNFHRDHLQHQLSVTSAFHLYQPAPPPSLLKHNGIRAYFYNNENVLMYSGYANTGSEKDTEKLTSSFQLSFPRMENMQRIQLVENNFSIGEFYIAPVAPQIYITGIDFREDAGNRTLHLSWEGSTVGPTQPSLSYSVRYSVDGLQWHPLFVNINSNKCLVNLDQLPGGSACRLQILASAGLRTSTAETYHFELPVKPRKLYWLHPKPQQTCVSGQPLYFSAMAYSPNFKNALQEEITWTSIKHGYLGTGQQLAVTHLGPGKDWIQVHIPDGLGNLLTKQMEISII